jgi:antitoxin (DNA-binding transcriptional repressor) of toxin-antitoxin stability system
MTSVTAKKLRDNLSEYLDRLQKGEEILIIRHSEIIGSLKPAQDPASGNGTAVAAMLNRNREMFQQNRDLTDKAVPTKELYHGALDEKHS